MAAARPAAISLSSKHAMLAEWTPFIIGAATLAGDGWQALPKLRNLPAVQRPLPITVLAARHIMRTKILSRLSKWLCAAIAAASAAVPLEAAASGGGAAFLEKLSLNPQPSQILVVCHGFGCAYRNQFVLTPARVANLRA